MVHVAAGQGSHLTTVGYKRMPGVLVPITEVRRQVSCLVAWLRSREAEVNMFEHRKRKIRARNKPGHYMEAPAKMIGCCAL